MAPVPEYPGPGENIIVDTDASNVGIGSFLLQASSGLSRANIGLQKNDTIQAGEELLRDSTGITGHVKTLKYFHKTSTGKGFTCAPTTPL
jgi:hypothetical protein